MPQANISSTSQQPETAPPSPPSLRPRGHWLQLSTTPLAAVVIVIATGLMAAAAVSISVMFSLEGAREQAVQSARLAFKHSSDKVVSFLQSPMYAGDNLQYMERVSSMQPPPDPSTLHYWNESNWYMPWMERSLLYHAFTRFQLQFVAVVFREGSYVGCNLNLDNDSFVTCLFISQFGRNASDPNSMAMALVNNYSRADGTLLGSGVTRHPYDPRTREIFVNTPKVHNIAVWSNVYLSAITSVPVVSYLRPLFTPATDEFIGISCFDVGLREIDAAFKQMLRDQPAESFLVDNNLRLVASSIAPNVFSATRVPQDYILTDEDRANNCQRSDVNNTRAFDAWMVCQLTILSYGHRPLIDLYNKESGLFPAGSCVARPRDSVTSKAVVSNAWPETTTSDGTFAHSPSLLVGETSASQRILPYCDDSPVSTSLIPVVESNASSTVGPTNGEQVLTLRLDGEAYYAMVSNLPFLAGKAEMRWRLVVLLPESSQTNSVFRGVKVAIGVSVATLFVLAVAVALAMRKLLSPLGSVARKMTSSSYLRSAEGAEGSENGEDEDDEETHPAARILSYLKEVAAIQQAYWDMVDELRYLRSYIPEHLRKEILRQRNVQNNCICTSTPNDQHDGGGTKSPTDGVSFTSTLVIQPLQARKKIGGATRNGEEVYACGGDVTRDVNLHRLPLVLCGSTIPSSHRGSTTASCDGTGGGGDELLIRGGAEEGLSRPRKQRNRLASFLSRHSLFFGGATFGKGESRNKTQVHAGRKRDKEKNNGGVNFSAREKDAKTVKDEPKAGRTSLNHNPNLGEEQQQQHEPLTEARLRTIERQAPPPTPLHWDVAVVGNEPTLAPSSFYSRKETTCRMEGEGRARGHEAHEGSPCGERVSGYPAPHGAGVDDSITKNPPPPPQSNETLTCASYAATANYTPTNPHPTAIEGSTGQPILSEDFTRAGATVRSSMRGSLLPQEPAENATNGFEPMTKIRDGSKPAYSPSTEQFQQMRNGKGGRFPKSFEDDAVGEGTERDSGPSERGRAAFGDFVPSIAGLSMDWQPAMRWDHRAHDEPAPIFFGDNVLVDREISVVLVNIVQFHRYVLCTHSPQITREHAVITKFLHSTARKCGGILENFMGDHFWVSFNATSKCDYHSIAATCFALQVTSVMNTDAILNAPTSSSSRNEGDDVSMGTASRERTKKPSARNEFRAARCGVTCGVATGRAFVGPMGIDAIRRHTIISNAVPEAAALERQAIRYPNCGLLLGGDTIPLIDGYFQYLLVDASLMPGSGGKRRRIATVKAAMCAEGCRPEALRGLADLEEARQRRVNPYDHINASFNAFLEGRVEDCSAALKRAELQIVESQSQPPTVLSQHSALRGGDALRDGDSSICNILMNEIVPTNNNSRSNISNEHHQMIPPPVAGAAEANANPPLAPTCMLPTPASAQSSPPLTLKLTEEARIDIAMMGELILGMLTTSPPTDGRSYRSAMGDIYQPVYDRVLYAAQ